MSDTIPAAPAINPPPRRRPSPARWWKLGLAMVLVFAFAVSWFAIDSARPVAAPSQVRSRRGRVAQLPPPRQARPAPSPARSRRAERIRTRSS